MKTMLDKITEHIYVRPYERYSDRPNIGLIRGRDRSVLYDAGNSPLHAKAIRQDLNALGFPLPDYVAMSHWHWDHTFGACAWDAVILSGCETNTVLRRMQTWKWDEASMNDRVDRGVEIAFCHEMIQREYPDTSQIQVQTADIVFDERLTLDLGGVTCELIHAGGPHSEDSVICYIPSEEFVFLGDSYGKDLYGLPWKFNIAHETDFSAMVNAFPYDYQRVSAYLDTLNTLNFTHCIGGHGKVLSREELYRKLS